MSARCRRVYIAGAYADRDWASQCAACLSMRGVLITSRWHEGPPNANERYLARNDRQEICLANVEDMLRADAVVLFHDERGRGSLVEAGMALGMRKALYIVGDPMRMTLMLDQRGVAWAPTMGDLIARFT